MTHPTSALSNAQRQAYDALAAKQYFKLICGGSFTDLAKVSALTSLYSQAGIDCIDIAPDETVLSTVDTVLNALPKGCPAPMVMVSLPLDPDPHFRKIELDNPACITCNACIPVCPTEALAEGGRQEIEPKILIDQPLCYGCGRCADICPTQALLLHPIYGDARFGELLSHPRVEAVEIHSRHMDPYMLTDFLTRFGSVLQGKIISVCFRPQSAPTEQWLQFLQRLQAATPWPILLQIDGEPMSGSEDPQSSLPALEAARQAHALTANEFPYLTISGGINAATSVYLQQPDYSFVAGVGMGTVARHKVWSFLSPNSLERDTGLSIAQELVARFKHPTSHAQPFPPNPFPKL
jgi:ferredoxin